MNADPNVNNRTSRGNQLAGIVVAVAALVAIVASIIVVWGTNTAMEKLRLATGYALLIFLFFLAITVLLEILLGKIDLSGLLEELSSGASMSRFQLLVFTFVIAFSFFIVVTADGAQGFPDIPNSVLVLLGVSAGTYGVGKGLQVSSGDVGAHVSTSSTTTTSAPGTPTQSTTQQTHQEVRQ